MLDNSGLTQALSVAAMRRVRYFDADHQRFLVFLTNNFELPALIIANLYKARLAGRTILSKWIKQHLRIKAFYGTKSKCGTKPNLDYDFRLRYVLVAIIKKELRLSASLYQILQVLSVSDFRADLHFTGTCSGTR